MKQQMSMFKWLYPGLRIKRWLLLALCGVLMFIWGAALLLEFKWWTALFYIANYLDAGYLSKISLIFIGSALMLIGICVLIFSLKKGLDSIINILVPYNETKLVETIYQKRQLLRGPKVVAIGGGTGLPTLLKGLKKYTSNLTAIVAVTDDGGCSGKLRDELGIIPLGDLRNNLVALADKEGLLEELLNYRFNQNSSLSGRSLGNLLIAAMADITDDVNKSIQDLSKVLAISGTVLPVSLSSIVLKAVMDDGSEIIGETQIVKSGKKIKKISIIPEDCEPMPEAIVAVEEADVVILGPGSLYTSVISNLLIKKLAAAVLQSKAKVYYVCNVMTQPGETDTYNALEHLWAIKEYLPGVVIDKMIVNTEKISDELLNLYAKKGAQPVVFDKEAFADYETTILLDRLLDTSQLVRHDSDKLAKLIMREILKDISATDKMKIFDLILGERYKDLTG